MAIYDKAISALGTHDVAELLTEGAVENIRLEFKKEIPGKDETLKKLSSFANTYGGYLIVGAEADNDGRLLALNGVLPQSNYKQKIIQWCFDSLAPAIQPFVSDPIQAPGNSGQVVYVIYVEESAEAPHFLNSRKGCFIRTDEFSQRFGSGLATYSEIHHLANRRSNADRRRESLYDRANERFETYIRLDYQSTPGIVGSIGATLKVAVSPRFPVRPLIEPAKLPDVIERSRIKSQGTLFPINTHVGVRQFESIVVPNALGTFSMLDVSIWGHVFYALELEEERKSKDGTGSVFGVSLPKLVGELAACVYHSGQVLPTMGYDGSIQLAVRLERIGRIPFWRQERWTEALNSQFDHEVGFAIDTNTRELTSSPDSVVGKLLSVILHAINWKDAGDDIALNRVVRIGYDYNRWPPPAAL